MTSSFTRTFNADRAAQGFKSQAHLDAFFAAFDHAKTCPVCSTVRGFVPLDDGMQPVLGRCDVALALDAKTDAARAAGSKGA